MTKKDLERFWQKVKVDRETGCWIWLASVRTWRREPWDGGYPAFSYRGKIYRGHIFAFRVLFGHWPLSGQILMHGCDNRRCVNVLEHIRPGTQTQNVKDMLAKGRSIHQRRNGTIGEIHEEPKETMAPDRTIQVDPADPGGRRDDDRRRPGAPC